MTPESSILEAHEPTLPENYKTLEALALTLKSHTW